MPNRPRQHLAEQSKRAKKVRWSAYDSHRGSPSRRGYDDRWKKLRLFALRRDFYRCVMCNLPVGKSGHVDHIVPKTLGGDDTMDNLQTLCASCHGKKSVTDGSRGGGA